MDSKFIPDGMDEVGVLNAIEKAVANVAIAYRFGYHEVEDIKQEGRVLALEVLMTNKYDGRKPLENFLFRHVKNRLSNYKRKHYKRNDPPCTICHLAALDGLSSSCSKAIAEGQRSCRTYSSWYLRNKRKQNLMNLLNINELGIDFESASHSEFNDLLEEADAQLTSQDRKTLLRLQGGEAVPKNKREKLRVALMNILGDETLV